MDITSLKTSKDLEENGVILPFGDGTITLRSRQSEAYRKYMREIFKPHESSMALGILPDDVTKDLVLRSYAGGLITGWSGFTERGVPVEYSFEKALEYLNVSKFFDFVNENCDRLENYQESKEKLEVKN